MSGDGRWIRIGTRSVWETPFMHVREDRVRLPDGRETTYGVVGCGHCVGVLPFVDAETVILVSQFRYIAQRFTWEMPTGGVHAGESLDDAARRETAEEAGFRPEELIPISTYHTSKSSIEETAHLYLGAGLVASDAQPDDTESITTETFPFERVVDMVLGGEITDSMTIIAVLIAERRARQGSRGGPASGSPVGG